MNTMALTFDTLQYAKKLQQAGRINEVEERLGSMIAGAVVVIGVLMPIMLKFLGTH